MWQTLPEPKSEVLETAPPAAECSLTLYPLDTGTYPFSSRCDLTNIVCSARIERVLPQKWACGAAGSALPWHGRGHRFDPDQVHQSFQAFRGTSLPRLCRILIANSRIFTSGRFWSFRSAAVPGSVAVIVISTTTPRLCCRFAAFVTAIPNSADARRLPGSHVGARRGESRRCLRR